VFHVCTSFCRIVYAYFSFLRLFNFLMAIFSLSSQYHQFPPSYAAAAAAAAAVAAAIVIAAVAAAVATAEAQNPKNVNKNVNKANK
jgi:hypothetical protein